MKRNAKATALLLALLLLVGGAGHSAAQSPAPDALHATGVVINEILAHTDEPQVDTVEFYNPTGAPISMAGWWFSDGSKVEDRVVLPADAVVPPNGYWMLKLPEGSTPRLSEMGEKVTLTATDANGAPTGNTESVTFGASPNGVSLGRLVTSDGLAHFPLQVRNTLGAANAGPRFGPVLMAELMYNPKAGDYEYIELINAGSTVVRLYEPVTANRWQIEGVGGFELPPSLVLRPGGSLFVTAVSPTLFRTRYNLPADVEVVGSYSGGLDNEGERVALLSPEPPNQGGAQEVPYVVVDEVEYLPVPPWPSEANGAGPALTRAALDGTGLDPSSWMASELPLDAGPTATVVRAVVLPVPGGGRALQWSTSREWRLQGFLIWRGLAGSSRAEALPVGNGGLVLPKGNRHMGGAYAVIDGAADADATYTYWLEAQIDGGEPLALLSITSPPPTMVLLPVVKR